MAVHTATLPPGVTAPYDWATEQLRLAEAHAITRGDERVTVAVIDLGYRFHPDHEGHLWENPGPTRGDRHGWDFADDDASLEYTGPGEQDSTYLRGHQSFLVGELAVTAPLCPIMVLRVGYAPGQGESWWRAIDYAVEHGAKVLVIPHGYLQGQCASGLGYFYQGTDFGYPFDSPDLKRAYDDAHRAGCLIVSGTADNRGRRACLVTAAFEGVIAVGSSDRRGQAADIANSADYVEVAAPSGRRDTEDPREQVWGTGGDSDYIPFEGGCMSAGFAGGVLALIMSRYPEYDTEQVRQILCNTARGKGWDHRLGHGVVDAAAAVSLRPEQRAPRLLVRPETATIRETDQRRCLQLVVDNPGVFDVRRGLVVAYNGDPTVPADPQATVEQPATLITSQLGHTLCSVTGLEQSGVSLALSGDEVPPHLWVQTCVCDTGAPAGCQTVEINL